MPSPPQPPDLTRGHTPESEPGPDGDRRGRGRPRRPRRRRAPWALAALLVLVVALAAACAEDRDDVARAPDAVTDTARDGRAAEQQAGEAGGGAAGGGDADGDDAGGAVEQVGGLGGLDDADPDRRLIRDGTVTVGYADTFDAAYRQVTALARRHGGGLLDIESHTDDDDVTRGSVTVEVPVGEYDGLLDDVADVGPVLRRDVRTEDVTEEFVDLRSRLRHLERTEEFFLDLFDEAETVDEAITIRDRLDSVQQRIEEIEGRLRRIEERTEMSRLTVELVPEGEAPHAARAVTAGFADYWGDAREAFVSVTGTLLVVAVGGAPLVVIAGLALLVAVVLVRAWRSGGSAGAAPAGAGGGDSASGAGAE